MKYLQLNDIDCYKRALVLSGFVWNVVAKWDWFSKRTVGVQFVTAIDSISANIAEGFGRYNKLEKIHHYRIAFGSMLESLDWNEKSKRRKLLAEKDYQHILEELKALPKEINQLINFTRDRLKQ